MIKLTTRNIVTGIAITTSLIAAVVLIRRRTFGKKLSDYIISDVLQKGKNLHGTIRDFENVFSGKPYLEMVKQKVNKNNNATYIVLQDSFVTQYRKDLHSAIAGLGTDVDKIKNVFFSLKDKVAVAQVAQSYLTHHKENLLTALLSESSLSEDSVAMKEIQNRLSTIPAYRLTKN